ncbi:MAG: CcmD family protein [Eggerthellaceae bacterium]|nr:CcmD family protein [Eggerthellaceae bacterium]
MNPILADIYSTVIPSAPYLIAAYALIWVALLVYVVFVVKGIKKTERQMAALEAAYERDSRATD